MPLKNGDTPLGEIVAVPGRGTLMGNRGILHDAERRVVRDWQVRRWIACRLEFRGRHRSVMTPGSYTGAVLPGRSRRTGGRTPPCAECRHADYHAFQTAWHTIYRDQSSSADAMGRVLHAERRVRPFLKRTDFARIDALPDGQLRAAGRPTVVGAGQRSVGPRLVAGTGMSNAPPVHWIPTSPS